MDRSRRVVIVSLGAVIAALPLAWAGFASAGSQEFSDDAGEIEHTMQAAAVLLAIWSVVVGAALRSLTRSLLLAVGVGALLTLSLGACLWYGYRTVRPGHLDPGFWPGAAGLVLRGLGLAVLGVAVGHAAGALARRFGLPAGVTAGGVLALGLLAEVVGAQIPTGRFQLSTHLVGWVAGDWLIYRPPADCSGQHAATCGMYHATWQQSLPVLATITVLALATGRLATHARRS